tara:strand:+ start:1941 stop:2588 length:648 start_codon:yes stop_codon:yes gene_type:complete
MSFTLGTLKTAIQDYLESSETTFVSNLDTIIKGTEDRIFEIVQLPQQRKNVTGNLTTGNRFLATPSDFYAPMSLAIISSNVYSYLDYKHPSFLKEYAPNSTSTGTPKYYALFSDESFTVAPVPDANFTVELHYLHKPASLTSGSDSGQTILSKDYPDALLMGCLVEGATFLKESPDTIASYEARFKEAVSRMKNLSEGRKVKDEYRYDSLRIGVS